MAKPETSPHRRGGSIAMVQSAPVWHWTKKEEIWRSLCWVDLHTWRVTMSLDTFADEGVKYLQRASVDVIGATAPDICEPLLDTGQDGLLGLVGVKCGHVTCFGYWNLSRRDLQTEALSAGVRLITFSFPFATRAENIPEGSGLVRLDPRGTALWPRAHSWPVMCPDVQQISTALSYRCWECLLPCRKLTSPYCYRNSLKNEDPQPRDKSVISFFQWRLKLWDAPSGSLHNVLLPRDTYLDASFEIFLT